MTAHHDISARIKELFSLCRLIICILIHILRSPVNVCDQIIALLDAAAITRSYIDVS